MWIIIEGLHHGKASALGFASGILAGLVAVTPRPGWFSLLEPLFSGVRRQ
jgi:ammonia channel protein AmtB